MNSIEEYQNMLELFKRALQFYANRENYLFYEHKDAPIALDEGAQARFALEQAKKLDEINQKAQDDYDKIMAEGIDTTTDNEIEKIINTFKTLGQEDGNKI